MEILNIILIFIFVILQVLDFGTTAEILNKGGRENWITMKIIIDKFGIKGLIISKAVLIVMWSVIFFINRGYQIVTVIQIVFIAIYSYVVWKNYTQIKQ